MIPVHHADVHNRFDSLIRITNKILIFSFLQIHVRQEHRLATKHLCSANSLLSTIATNSTKQSF
jgi:hypothetical protein